MHGVVECDAVANLLEVLMELVVAECVGFSDLALQTFKKLWWIFVWWSVVVLWGCVAILLEEVVELVLLEYGGFIEVVLPICKGCGGTCCGGAW